MKHHFPQIFPDLTVTVLCDRAERRVCDSVSRLLNQWTTRALQTSNEGTNHARILRPC